MQDPDKSSYFTAAALIVLMALVVSQFLIAGRQQEHHDTLMQNIAAVKSELAATQEAQKQKESETPPVVDQLKAVLGSQDAIGAKIDDEKNEIRQLREDMQKQAETLSNLQQNYDRMALSHEQPTAAQRTAAEQFYKKYLDPDMTKVVSRQVPAGLYKNSLQGFKMTKWIYFRAEGNTATLVGMGEAYLNIKPEDLNAPNYGVYYQGRLGTMIVVNFQTKDDPVFAQCRKSFDKGFAPEKLLAVFGHGVAEQIMHDGFYDEAILNVDQLVSCSLGDNP